MAAGKAKLKRKAEGVAPAAGKGKPNIHAWLEEALALHKRGRMAEAKALYEKILVADPRNADASQLLGVLCHRQGDIEGGRRLLERAVAIDPNNSVARNNLGCVLQVVGDYIAADRAFSDALRLTPIYPDALANRGSVLCAMERYDEAAACLRRGLQLDPHHLDARRNLARVYMKLKMFPEAEAELRTYLRRVPDNADEAANLAFAVQQQGRLEEGEELFRQALELAKGNPVLLQNLRGLLGKDRRSEEERAEFRIALRDNPGMWAVEVSVAANLIERGKLEEARQIFDDILAVFPDRAGVWCDIGGTLVTLGRYEEAERVLQRAYELDPKSAAALNNLGNVHMFFGRLDRAIEVCRRSLALDPTSAQTAMTLARALYQSGEYDQAHIFARAARDMPSFGIEQTPSMLGIYKGLCDFDGLDSLGDIWDIANRLQLDVLVAFYLNLLPLVRDKTDVQKFVALVRKWAVKTEAQALHAPLLDLPPTAVGEGKIRVGILSSDLRGHSVSRFLMPFIQGYDRSRIEVHCYTPLRLEADMYQAEYRRMVDGFTYVDNMTPREIAERIRGDGIEVLLELNGFTHESRLPATAYKPAPIQMSWIGYPATCGLKAIDYVVLDRFVAPTDESTMVEQPLIMPEAYVCFGKFPEVAIDPVLPMERNGYVTFGTLNNPYKFNRETIAMWAQILRQVPDSRFLIVRPEASSVVLCKNLVAEFEKHGIGGDRLYLFDNRQDNRNHLAFYNEIDISLDTYPLTGGTTTCEAIWMGVPVVSLVGEANHQRISYSVLMHCGLEELCVFTPEEYVARAVALVGERDKLAAWRTGMREVMRQSPLCDEPRFIYQFQEMLEQVARLHGLR